MKKIWFGYWFKNWFFLYKIGYAVVISGIRSYFKNHQYYYTINGFEGGDYDFRTHREKMLFKRNY